jgi:hypothetical protein
MDRSGRRNSRGGGADGSQGADEDKVMTLDCSSLPHGAPHLTHLISSGVLIM